MIGAVVVGTLCTFVMTTYVLPDRPERVLRATIRALRARMAIVVDTTAEAVRTGRLDERRRRRMRARTTRLNETALMVQGQIEDKADPGPLWPGVTGEQLAPWLFDAELAIEWVATAGRRAAGRGRSRHTRRHPRRTGRGAHPAGAGHPAPRSPAGCGRPRARLNGFSTGSRVPPRPMTPARPRAPSRPGDHQRGDGDCRGAGDRRGRRRGHGRRRGERRHRRTPAADEAADEPSTACCRPPGKPSRCPSPHRWPS